MRDCITRIAAKDPAMDHFTAAMNRSFGILIEDIEHLRAIYFAHNPH